MTFPPPQILKAVEIIPRDRSQENKKNHTYLSSSPSIPGVPSPFPKVWKYLERYILYDY
jgi:hypothetical protein